MIFLYFCLLVLKSLSQMAFYFSNLILQTASHKFLNAEDLFFNVRDIVFLENEGICYYDAIQT